MRPAAPPVEALGPDDVVDIDDFELVHVDLEDASRLVASRRPAKGGERRSRWTELEPLLERHRLRTP